MKYSPKNLMIEPYRLFFFAGVLMAISIGLHLFFLYSPEKLKQLSDSGSFSMFQIHAFELLFCTFSYFAFGFLLTAFPRWTHQTPFANRSVLLWGFALVSSELVLFYGFYNPEYYYLLTPLVFFLFATLIFSMGKKWLASPGKRQSQPLFVLVGLALGGVGALLGCISLIHPDWIEIQVLSVQLGIYGYIILLIIAGAWRMIPFYTRKAFRNVEIPASKYLSFIFFLLMLRILGEFFDLFFPEILPGVPFILWGIDGLIFFLLLREIFLWIPAKGWRKIMQTPLLLVLYLSLFWLLVFLVLSPLKLLAHWAFPGLETFLLFHEKDFLHFLTLGCMGTLILAIMVRVTRGHGGLSLQLGFFGGLAVFFMQGSMVLRVFFPLCPRLAPYRHVSGLFWTLAFIVWAFGYFPVLLQKKIIH